MIISPREKIALIASGMERVLLLRSMRDGGNGGGGFIARVLVARLARGGLSAKASARTRARGDLALLRRWVTIGSPPGLPLMSGERVSSSRYAGRAGEFESARAARGVHDRRTRRTDSNSGASSAIRPPTSARSRVAR